MNGMPEYFEKQLRELVGSRYGEFERAWLDKPRHKALRVNTLKISVEDFLEFKPELKPNGLCPQSFYFFDKPSLNPLYHAGLYYMQEPSASAAVFALSPFIGERVLDLCAAPGGKSTQVAAFMRGGAIFCNDVDYKRIGALKENIERLGVKNAVVTHSNAKEYRKAGFDGYFDTLVVDAPCSGGGMMRYETVPYSEEIVKGCAARQRAILDDAVMLLCRGGYMLYSTCTFSREENEDNVKYILDKGFELVDIPLPDGAERGIDGIGRRIYPHNFDGEGHFYCVLKKTSGDEMIELPCEKNKREEISVGGASVEAEKRGDDFVIKDFELPRIKIPPAGRGTYGENISFRYNRVGVPVYCESGIAGTREFSHALSHALDGEILSELSVELGDRAPEYIRGEQIPIEAPHGQRIATVNGYALGWVKSARSGDGTSVLKNLYPKALRN